MNQTALIPVSWAGSEQRRRFQAFSNRKQAHITTTSSYAASFKQTAGDTLQEELNEDKGPEPA